VADALAGCADISLDEAHEVQLKGLAGDHWVSAVDWAA
jgi:hypothetical protein